MTGISQKGWLFIEPINTYDSNNRFYGVGYLINKRKSDNPRAYNIWREMLRRCYDKSADRYDLYGGDGVEVDNRWFCFDNFLNDIKKLPGWDEEKFNDKRIQLDKDKLQIDVENKIYSKNTCCWLTREEQYKYSNRSKRHKEFVAISPDGITYKCNNQKLFATKFGLQKQNLNKCLKNKRKHHFNWRFYYMKEFKELFDLTINYKLNKEGDLIVLN